MPKFRVYGIWSASKVIGTFEAATAEEAKSMAEMSDENDAHLCHQCAHDIELNDYCADSFDAELVEEK